MDSNNYHQDFNQKMTLKLREIMKELPSFTASFFIAVENTSTILTRVNYAADLRIFFQFLIREVPYFAEKSISSITKEDLKAVTVDDLYLFLDYLNLYLIGNLLFISNRHLPARIAAFTSPKYLSISGIVTSNH